MNFSWLFSAEVPLPHGHRFVVLHHESGELGAARLRDAAAVLGPEAADAAARKLGRYELDDESVRTLGLAGAKAGEGGEVPALSPERWTELPPAETGESLEASDGEVVGLALTQSQRESFLRFLARNHVKESSALDAAKAVRLARHFFFQEPLLVVLRYTPPRFARS